MTTWEVLKDLYRTDRLSKQAIDMAAIATVFFFIALIWPNPLTVGIFAIFGTLAGIAGLRLMHDANKNMKGGGS